MRGLKYLISAVDPNPNSDPTLTLLGWTAWKRFLSKFEAWTLLIKLLNQIHLHQYSWRRDCGNPNFAVVFVSNAKQYQAIQLMYCFTCICIVCRNCQQASLKKRVEDVENQECVSCDFWRQIGKLLPAVNFVFSVLLDMMSCLKVSVFYLCPLPCELWV